MYHFVVSLFQPLTFGFLCVILATLFLWRKRRGRRRRLIIATVLLLLFAFACTGLAGHFALRTLESSYVQLKQIPNDISTIVVLAGGLRIHDDSHPENVELLSDTIYRCINAAELYHARKNDSESPEPSCTVLLSGCHSDPAYSGKPAAELMRDFLIQLGVDPSDILVEDSSLTTYENALKSADILNQRGVQRIALVTDATHMYRASRCFTRQGFEVVPAACNFRAARQHWSPRFFLPSSSGVGGLRIAMHEWLGILWYKLHGRI